MADSDFPAPSEGFVVTHFLVSADVDASRAFYEGVLGGETVMDADRPSSSWPTRGSSSTQVAARPTTNPTSSSTLHENFDTVSTRLSDPDLDRQLRAALATFSVHSERPAA